jgi:hypothetical protein
MKAWWGIQICHFCSAQFLTYYIMDEIGFIDRIRIFFGFCIYYRDYLIKMKLHAISFLGFVSLCNLVQPVQTSAVLVSRRR